MGFLKDMFKKRYNVTIYLKSGERVHVNCTKFEIKRNNGNDLSEYLAEGMKDSKILYLRLDDVSAITYN